MALLAIGIAGCNNKKTSGIPVNESVADVSAPAPVTSYQPAPQPAAEPVAFDAASASSSTIASGTYTIKKGDTLYSIARQRYGDGKQWTRIAAANPGIRPEALKVGQTIVIP